MASETEHQDSIKAIRNAMNCSECSTEKLYRESPKFSAQRGKSVK